MYKLLEDLWNNFYLEKNSKLSNEGKEAFHNVVEMQKEIYESLNKDEIELFEKYEELRRQYDFITQQEIFIGGIGLAVRFIIEAMEK